MIPTLDQLFVSLETPDLSLATLSGCQLVRDAAGSVVMERSSRFAEVRIVWQGGEYLLCCPLWPTAIPAVDSFVHHYVRIGMTDYRILRDELQIVDSTGRTHRCDVVLQQLPEGELLCGCVGERNATDLLEALDEMERRLQDEDVSHNNLKPNNIVVTPYGQMIPIRYHFARCGFGGDAEGLAALRDYVRERACPTGGMPFAASVEEWEIKRFPGHRFVGRVSDLLVRVEDAAGYGFVDTQNRPVIAAQYLWANDFREDRAEVKTPTGMGLIDKRGCYVVEPRYEIVDFDPATTLVRLRLDGRWAVADYEGRLISDFAAEIPSDEMLSMMQANFV